MNRYDLKPISDLVEDIRRKAKDEAARAAKYALEQAEERIRRVELTRQGVSLLDGSGVTFDCVGETYAAVNLGFFASTRVGNAKLAEAVRAIRDAVGCRLEVAEKDVDDVKKKTVRITLKPVDFPTIRIYYSRKLPKDAKCRIVRHRSSYTSLVCEV